MWTRLLIAAGFLLLPILWGIAVNGLFDLWRRDDDRTSDENSVFPDYQI